MKRWTSFILLLLVLPILFLSSYVGHVLIGCLIVAGILAYNLVVMGREMELEPPRCNECGRPLQEGNDMDLEDDFVEPPKRPM